MLIAWSQRQRLPAASISNSRTAVRVPVRFPYRLLRRIFRDLCALFQRRTVKAYRVYCRVHVCYKSKNAFLRTGCPNHSPEYLLIRVKRKAQTGFAYRAGNRKFRSPTLCTVARLPHHRRGRALNCNMMFPRAEDSMGKLIICLPVAAPVS